MCPAENQCEDSSVSCCECRIDAGAGVEERSLLSCFVENTGDRVEAFMVNGPYGEYGHWDAMTNKRIAAAR